jgi:hypothetical protein
MMNMTYRRLLAIYIWLAMFLTPVIVLAKGGEDEETARLEARLEGYPIQVRMPSGSTALTWLMIGFLSAITIAVLFKNAKRTHLD